MYCKYEFASMNMRRICVSMFLWQWFVYRYLYFPNFSFGSSNRAFESNMSSKFLMQGRVWKAHFYHMIENTGGSSKKPVHDNTAHVQSPNLRAAAAVIAKTLSPSETSRLPNICCGHKHAAYSGAMCFDSAPTSPCVRSKPQAVTAASSSCIRNASECSSP